MFKTECTSTEVAKNRYRGQPSSCSNHTLTRPRRDPRVKWWQQVEEGQRRSRHGPLQFPGSRSKTTKDWH